MLRFADTSGDCVQDFVEDLVVVKTFVVSKGKEDCVSSEELDVDVQVELVVKVKFLGFQLESKLGIKC